MILRLLSFLFIPVALFYLIKTKQNWQHRLPPGPLPLPIIGHFHHLGPLIHHCFRDLCCKYGPLIHLKLGSVSCVVASTPELAKELLKTHELTFSARKHSFAIDQLTYHSSFAFAPYGPYWKFIKKISTFELLGNRMLNQFQPIRAKELHQFLHLIYAKSKAGESVNLTEELIKLSNNIISRMMFGVRSSGTDSQAEVARNLIREVTQLFGEFNVSDFLWFLKNVDLQGFRNKIEDLHRRYDDFLENIISTREKERIENGKSLSEKKDFLDILLDVREDDQQEMKLTREHIKALVLDFLTAATDTTAITIEWAIAELLNHPKLLNKAREEIEKIAGNNRLVEETDGPNLRYIDAILKETFRLHPPIPMIARKSTQDCKVNGYAIPSNSLLFVNIWAIGRDPKYWKDPLEFQPERFLELTKENMDIKGQHYQLLPFGTGRRSCPGMPLALKSLPVTLAAMIQCFDWKVTSSHGEKKGDGDIIDMSERPGLTAPRANDLVCLPVARMVNILEGFGM